MSVIDSPPSTNVKRRMRAQFRATPDLGEGKFEALVSAYDVEYGIGWGWTEKIAQGAFAESIAAQNGVVPIMYEHEWGQAPVGDAIATESKLGLIVRGGLYLDTDPFVQRIWKAMMADALREYSIAFFPQSFAFDTENPTLDIVTKGELIEASICVRGANPETETLDLRSGQVAWIDTDKADEEVGRLKSLRTRTFAGAEIRRPERDDRGASDQEKFDQAFERQMQKSLRKLADAADAGDLLLSPTADAIVRALVDPPVRSEIVPAVEPTADPVVSPVVEPVTPAEIPVNDPSDPVVAPVVPDPNDPVTPIVGEPIVEPAPVEGEPLSEVNLLASPWARALIRDQFASAQTS